MIVELSKTISALPLLEGVELSPDDCMLREHNAYLRLLQPEDDAGEPIEPSLTLTRRIEATMRIVDDGPGVRVEGQSKVKTRVSTENISKVPKKFPEFRQEHEFRIPRHDAMVEVKTFDVWLNPKSAYRDAPLGVGLMRLYLNRNLKLRVGTNAGILQTEESLGNQSLKDFTSASQIPRR